MQLKALSGTILLLSLFGMGLAQADSNLEFGAGNLDDGQKVTIKKFGPIASYDKKGTSGSVKFACTLTPKDQSSGSDVTAVVYGGKNFASVSNWFTLNHGSRTVTWSMHNSGSDHGNVKVQLIKGDKNDEAYVQCQTVSSIK